MNNVTHNSFLCDYFYFSLYMFRAHRAHHQERQIVSIQPLVAVTLYRGPCRLQVGSELDEHDARSTKYEKFLYTIYHGNNIL